MDPAHPDIVAEIMRRADEAPGATALVHGPAVTTYRDLVARADALSMQLAASGVVSGDRVAIWMPRSPDLVVSLLAVLNAGAAYVPLDHSYPHERLHSMLAASRPKLLLVGAGDDDHWSDGLGVPTARIADRNAESISQPQRTPSPGPVAADPAYALFTSGSTGHPKCVVVSRSALNFLVAGMSLAFGIGRRDRVLQFAAISWDTSAEEIWPCLAQGGTVVLRTEAMVDPIALADACWAHELTVLDLPTAFFPLFFAAARMRGVPPSLRAILIGGERAAAAHVRAWRELAPRVRLYNTYGVTEATAISLWCDLTDDPLPADVVPIGQPLPGAIVHVLDHAGKPVPDGETGELVIGGAGVALGYLDQPSLTEQRFVADPLRPGARVYRTGDFARRRPDGLYEYAGRRDDQVKIRGARVELGEVEAMLLASPDVREAVALATDGEATTRRLLAFVVPRVPALDVDDLRGWLRARYPSHLLPDELRALEAFPLLPNGKVDRRRLLAARGPGPDPDGAHDSRFADVRAAWEECLGHGRFGLDDNFFEVGGNSLNVIALRLALLRRVGADLAASALFAHPTIRSMQALVDRTSAPPFGGAARSGGAGPIDVAGKATPSHRTPRERVRLPVTPSQQLLFEECTRTSIEANNLELLVACSHSVQDVTAAIATLLERHDVFWIERFESTANGDQQWFAAGPIQRHVEVDRDPGAEARLAEHVLAARRRISFETGCFYRWIAVEAPERVWVYFIGNHLLFDAVSMQVLHDELVHLLEARHAALPETISFAEWIQATGSDDALAGYRQRRDLWCAQLQRLPIVSSIRDSIDAPPGLEVIFADRPRRAETFVQRRHATLLGVAVHQFGRIFDTASVPCLWVHSGRNQHPGQSDSMTVGWLAHHYPASITIGDTVETTIATVRDAIAELAPQSLGYAWLRSLREFDDPNILSIAELPFYFNYLPRVLATSTTVIERNDVLPAMPEARDSGLGVAIVVEELGSDDTARERVIVCYDRTNMAAANARRLLDSIVSELGRFE